MIKYKELFFTAKIPYLPLNREVISPEGGALKLAEMKNAYEFMLVVSVKLGEKTEELVNKFKDLISEKAELVNMDNWGKKKLAYMINKESEAEYVVFDFNSDSEFPKELDRICQITDGVLRSMIVKKS